MTRTSSLAGLLCLAVLSSAACGGGATTVRDGGAPSDGGAIADGGAADAGAVDRGAPSTRYPAFDIDWPEVEGAPIGVLATPRFVAITFDGDPLRAGIEDYVSRIGSSAYWRLTTAEYGVGPGTARTPVHLATAAPAVLDDADVQAFLRDRLDGTHAEWPAPDGQTIYALFYPSGTRVSIPGFGNSCFAFGAYHGSFTLRGEIVAYAVHPRCPARPSVPGLGTELAVLQGVTAHELVEAATNFDVVAAQGYVLPPPEHIAFVTFAGAELGDMCQFNPAAWVHDAEVGGTVQRSWSNAASAAGREPCVPAPAGPYFVAVPQMTEDVTVVVQGSAEVTRGVALARGESKTVQLLLVASADTGGPFNLSAVDREAFFGRARTLSFSFDRAQGQNGEKVYLTITRVGTDPNFGGGMPFAIIARQGETKNYWFSVVGSR